jgi:arylsulfatase A-like enzyme
MPDENILVIAVDGLRAAVLGAYGNTAYSTPALDQFAAESLLFDWCYTEAVELPAIYKRLWHGEPQLINSLAVRGYSSTLISDDADVAALGATAQFGECIQLPATLAERADEVSHTSLARVFAAASEQIESAEPGRRMLWVHSRGMYGPWDAPLDLQEELLAREEGDPPPEDVLDPPDLWLDEHSDPDATFRWSCAYAAQVMALDACFEGLCQTIEEAVREQWQIVLLGVRGFPLGEHGRVGGVDGRLYAEQLHVPLLRRFPNGTGKLARSSKLVSHADLPTAILSAADGKFQTPEHDALLAVGPTGERSIRTADWCLRTEPCRADEQTGEELSCQLFVRPDDHWEANDVSALCREEVASLLARLREPSAD